MPRLPFIPVLIACSLAALAQDAPDPLPEGKGKAEVKKICSDCHEIGTVTGSRRTRIGWERSVEDMAARGAQGSDDDMAVIVDYLTKFFGKINVNTASSKELVGSLGISDKDAQAIVAWREQHGNFKDFEQLIQVPGILVEKLRAKRMEIAFSL